MAFIDKWLNNNCYLTCMNNTIEDEILNSGLAYQD